ncbi:hypothetical protein HDU67_004391 [Dinochytrium kinnereticum]|nr:hypothetical protein HDU67_004391 [Dinochytrium kinnereticum]
MRGAAYAFFCMPIIPQSRSLMSLLRHGGMVVLRLTVLLLVVEAVLLTGIGSNDVEKERQPSTSRASLNEHEHHLPEVPEQLPEVHTVMCDLQLLKNRWSKAVFGVRKERQHACGESVMEAVERGNARLREFANMKPGAYWNTSRPDASDPGVVKVNCDGKGSDEGCVFERVEWVVYSTGCTSQLNRLADQLKSLGIPLSVLGHGEAWRGYGHRMRSYHDYLIAMDPRAIVYVTDAEDVLANPSCDAKTAVEKYLRRGIPTTQIVFSAEQACYPDEYAASQFFESPVIHLPHGVRDPRTTLNPRVPGAESLNHGGEFQYLNAGTVVGRAVDMAAMLRRTYVHDCQDDQRTFTWTYLRGDSFWIDEEKAKGASGTGWERPADAVTDIEKEMVEIWREETGQNQTHSNADPHSKSAMMLSRFSAYPVSSRRQGARVPLGSEPIPPPHARPLISLDFDTDLFAGVFGHSRDDFDILPNGSLRLKSTFGEPCAIHQSGWKEMNSLLEELARDLGLEYSQKAIDSVERKRKGGSWGF